MDAYYVLEEISNKVYKLQDELEDPKCLDLGEIICALKKAISEEEEGGQAWITFDWGGAFPVGFDSYRGNYAELCLQYDGSHSAHITARDFLKMCESALNQEFYGWKGGTYSMDYDTPVHVACSGMSSEIYVRDIESTGYGIRINTIRIPD